MNETLRAFGERKQLLLARSRLHRLELQHQLGELRRSFARPRAALSLAASPAVRPLVLSALMALLGRGRAARLLKGALAALAVAKMLRSIYGWMSEAGEGEGR